MEKNEILEQTLKTDNSELIPATILKSELILITDDEFKQLIKHMQISDYQMSEYEYDTIIICNNIFKKIN